LEIKVRNLTQSFLSISSVPSLLHARKLIHFNLKEILVIFCIGIRKKIRIKSSSLGRRIVEFVIETDPSIKQ
jgi:hypothetical protein